MPVTSDSSSELYTSPAVESNADVQSSLAVQSSPVLRAAPVALAAAFAPILALALAGCSPLGGGHSQAPDGGARLSEADPGAVLLLVALAVVAGVRGGRAPRPS